MFSVVYVYVYLFMLTISIHSIASICTCSLCGTMYMNCLNVVYSSKDKLLV